MKECRKRIPSCDFYLTEVNSGVKYYCGIIFSAFQQINISRREPVSLLGELKIDICRILQQWRGQTVTFWKAEVYCKMRVLVIFK